MTDAVIAQTAGDGVDPRKPPVPEAGAQHLLALDGTELVIIAKKNDRGTYYATTALVGAIGGTGGGGVTLTIASSGAITTVAPKSGDAVLNLVGDLLFGNFLSYSENTNDGTTVLQSTGGYGNTVETSNNAVGPTGYISLFTGDSATDNSGSIDLFTGLAAPGATTGGVAMNSGAGTDTAASGTARFASGPAHDGNSGALFLSTGPISGAGQSGGLSIYTGSAAANSTGEVGLASGNAGGGDSGNVRITVGTASGNRGSLLLDVNNIGCSNDGFVVNASAGPIAFFGSAALTPTSNGADVSFTPGPGGSSSGNGGNIHLNGGPTTAGSRGSIILDAPSVLAPLGDTFYVASAPGTGGNENTGAMALESGGPTGTGDSGNATFGTSDAVGGVAGGVLLYAGNSGKADTAGGSIVMTTGAATNGNADGGHFLLQTAAGHGTGVRGSITMDAGLIILDNLPTANPHVVGALWLNSGALAISAG